MKKFAIFAAAAPLALAACGPDSATEQAGDALEERADAIENLGDDRADEME